MKKSIKIILIVILGFFLLSIFSNVKAATASITASKTNITVGESVTISVKMNAAAWNTKLSGAVTKSFAGNSDDGENVIKTESVTFKPTSAGSYTINLSGDVSDGSTNATTNVSGSVTIKVSEKTTTNSGGNTGTTNNNSNNNNNNNNNNNSNKPQTTTPTTPQTKEQTFKSANETVYATGDINIRKSYTTDSDVIGKLKTGESVTRTGVGDNGWSKVSYNGTTGYIKSSLITTQEPAKSSDKSLKSLVITPEGLDPVFDPEVTTYTLTVGADVEKLDIVATPNDENATVDITGNEALQPGDNMVKITVTAQDGTTRIYNIDVKKQEAEVLSLTSLKIEGYTLSPKFSPDVFEYKFNILDPNVTSVNIEGIANFENAIINITGNTNLQQGENIIEITVTSEDGTETVIYKIYANKSAMPAATSNNNWVLYGGIGAIVILIILIIIIIIVSKKKNKSYEEENSEDYSDLYGYTSKGTKTDNNEKIDNITDKKYLEDELFGKMPEQNAEETQKMDVSQENPKTENNNQVSNNYDSYLGNNSLEFNYDNSNNEETNKDYGYDDYKPRRSKGKHSK